MKIIDGYEATRDQYGWTLIQTLAAKRRDGTQSTKKKLSYYPNIQQVMSAVIDREAGKCASIVELRDFIERSHREFVEKLKA